MLSLNKNSHWSVVDIFCGVGGLSHGFHRVGFQIAAGIDADRSCKHAFETNNDSTFVDRSIEVVSAEEIAALYPDGHRRILVGCAPCAPFSAYTPTHKKKSTDKWGLLSVFAERISQLQPEIVSMENVPRLKSFDRGRVLKDFIARLESNYHVSVKTVDCRDYGVPQQRRRLVLLASQHGPITLESPKSSDYRTVQDAIGHMPPLQQGESDPLDPIHRAAGLSVLNQERIRLSKPAGTWEDWPVDLRTKCHRRQSGRTYQNVYGRMSWNDAAPTITTGCFSFGRGRFGHPDQDRAISLREAALLQSFPPNYAFVADDKPVNISRVGRHIGNAVPVALGEAIASSIANHIANLV